MKYKKLGNTDLDVSLICLGTMTWGQQNTEEEGHEQMDYAVDRGVNFFDTAELYSIPPKAETQGSTETIIGTWFKKNKLFWLQKLLVEAVWIGLEEERLDLIKKI
jgi:aryl-alcohol dehydrogenase-like predicted oxidoreductase